MAILAGCSSNNRITQINGPDAVIKYNEKDTSKVRFNNLISKKPEYPVTCTEDCYPESPWVECQTPAQNCRYTGPQSTTELQSGFEIQWLGHASFSIKSSDGSLVLLDPVSRQFDWPVNWAFQLTGGVKRSEPAWLSEQTLKSVDAVLYSHIHYDHFNKSDIEAIGNRAKYYTPMGFAEHFPDGGYTINEMSWFSETSVNELNLTFVPANHFSGRIWVPFLYEDENTTLWGGWVIEQAEHKIFFAGDTGYSPHFKEIKNRLGAMDVCLMPIASYYHPEAGSWYRFVHTTPEDALIAAEELECKVMIPWGYGNNSWQMGDHSSHSALLRLLHMHQQLNFSVPLLILNENDTVQL